MHAARVNPQHKVNDKATDSQADKGRSNGRPDKGQKSRLMDVPTLTYGRDNNFLEFKSLFALRAITEYKDLGRLVELNAYYVPDAIYIDEEMLGEEHDPHGLCGHDEQPRRALLDAERTIIE